MACMGARTAHCGVSISSYACVSSLPPSFSIRQQEGVLIAGCVTGVLRTCCNLLEEGKLYIVISRLATLFAEKSERGAWCRLCP